jgi:hypothetical protein
MGWPARSPHGQGDWERPRRPAEETLAVLFPDRQAMRIFGVAGPERAAMAQLGRKVVGCCGGGQIDRRRRRRMMRRDQRRDDCGDEDAIRRDAEAVRTPHLPRLSCR